MQASLKARLRSKPPWLVSLTNLSACSLLRARSTSSGPRGSTFQSMRVRRSVPVIQLTTAAVRL